MMEIEGHRIVALGPDTWDIYEAMMQRHNGVFGGCWCLWFHLRPDPPERKQLGNQRFKESLVRSDRTHAALVLDGDEAIAWCQYGTLAELPNIKHRKVWESTVEVLPDYRITCVFVDKSHRRQGLATIAVRGALALIALDGGGLVEAYPHELPKDAKLSSSFIYSVTRATFERLGFTYLRHKGKNNCTMSLTVAPVSEVSPSPVERASH